MRNVAGDITDKNTPDFLRHGAHFGGALVLCGALIESKPVSRKEVNTIKSLLHTASTASSKDDVSGDFLVYDEEALRSLKELRHVGVNRVREIVIMIAKE